MATVPAPITFVAAAVLTAAQLNTNLRDAVNFLVAPPAVSLTNTTAQSIPNSAFTGLTWDTEVVDNDNMHSTSTNTDRITAVTAGYYLVTGNIEYANNVTGQRILRIVKNGITSVAGNTTATSVGFAPLSVSMIVFLAVGDFVRLEAFQSSGGALAMAGTGGAGTNGGYNFQALWVHS